MSKTTQLTSLFALVMLISGAIDSIRNLPATALFGAQLIFFCCLAAITFLIPLALISAELASRFPTQGGIYNWLKIGTSQRLAVFGIWLQWINTLIWYPTMLAFIAGSLAFVIDPQLATHRFYLMGTITLLFWLLTFANLFGVNMSARIATLCTVLGLLLPMSFMIIEAIIWLSMHHPTHIHLHANNWYPHAGHYQNWVSLTAIMASFLGIELATVHIRSIKNPQKQFPRALLASVILIVTTMILGSLYIAWLLPNHQINLVDGVLQANSLFFNSYGIAWATPVFAVLLLIGSIGGMINWIISPARGLLQAAQDGYLPKALQAENRYGVPYKIMLAQAVIVTLVTLAFVFVPSVNGAYWFLTDLSTELYLMMYLLLVLAAARIHLKYKKESTSFRIPGGSVGFFSVLLLLLLSCLAALFIGFMPPSHVNVGGAAHYIILFASGLIVMTLPGWLLCRFKRS